MITLELTVAEALDLALNYSPMYDRVLKAFEKTLNIDDNTSPNCTVTITNGMSLDNRIPCIKAVRQYTGWGLKEAKDWTDDLVGGWKGDRFVPATHHTNSITLKNAYMAESLLRELTTLGCEGYIS